MVLAHRAMRARGGTRTPRRSTELPLGAPGSGILGGCPRTSMRLAFHMRDRARRGSWGSLRMFAFVFSLAFVGALARSTLSISMPIGSALRFSLIFGAAWAIVIVLVAAIARRRT